MGLLRELVPKAEKIGILINPNYPLAAAYLRDAQEAAVQLGVGLVAVNASAENDFEPAFASLMQQSVGALMIIADPFFNSGVINWWHTRLAIKSRPCTNSVNLPRQAA